MLVDWLPWNHTFGGNHNVGLTLYNGGTLYIDDGKPTPSAAWRDAAQPARDRADGVLQRAHRLRGDRPRDGRPTPRCASKLLSRVQGLHVYAGAGAEPGGLGPPRPPCRSGHRRAHRACFTGLGMTETAPFCTFATGPRREARPHRPAGAGRRGQAGAGRRQDRDPLQGPERHARLLARAGRDRRRLRRRRLLPHRRRRAVCRRRRPAPRPAFRRPHRRGLQAVHRHLRQRRPAAHEDRRWPATRWCRTWCSPASTATTSAR